MDTPLTPVKDPRRRACKEDVQLEEAVVFEMKPAELPKQEDRCIGGQTSGTQRVLQPRPEEKKAEPSKFEEQHDDAKDRPILHELAKTLHTQQVPVAQVRREDAKSEQSPVSDQIPTLRARIVDI